MENSNLNFVKPAWIYAINERQKMLPYQPYTVVPWAALCVGRQAERFVISTRANGRSLAFFLFLIFTSYINAINCSSVPLHWFYTSDSLNLLVGGGFLNWEYCVNVSIRSINRFLFDLVTSSSCACCSVSLVLRTKLTLSLSFRNCLTLPPSLLLQRAAAHLRLCLGERYHPALTASRADKTLCRQADRNETSAVYLRLQPPNTNTSTSRFQKGEQWNAFSVCLDLI